MLSSTATATPTATADSSLTLRTTSSPRSTVVSDDPNNLVAFFRGSDGERGQVTFAVSGWC